MEKASARFINLTLLHTTKYNGIFRATDTTTKKRVIVKAPQARYAGTPTIGDNIIHEAEILKMLSALPCTQQYITHGTEHERGYAIPYLVTEEALGQSLYDMVRDEAHNGRLTHREGVQLMHEIARTLFSAHEFGIVHCDLKLGNILWDEETQRCTIMDWAAAVNLSTQHRRESDPVIGTAQFMSFEHVTGLMLDQRTDIYALGIIITLLVYGQELTPRYTFVDGVAKKRNKEETSDAVAHKETIKTDLFGLPESSYDWLLQQLLKRMTHWDRELRPRSMEEVVQECAKILR